MKHFYCYETKIGKIAIVSSEKKLTDIILNPPKINQYERKETKIMEETFLQIEEYLNGKRKEFSIDYQFTGTEFQKNVWKALLVIPYGETRSYKEISEFIEKPKAFRAVGMANHVNPLPIIIPCHRVIGSNGSLIGYGGGLPIKKFLLDLERENIS